MSRILEKFRVLLGSAAREKCSWSLHDFMYLNDVVFVASQDMIFCEKIEQGDSPSDLFLVKIV